MSDWFARFKVLPNLRRPTNIILTVTLLAFTCSKLTEETVEQGMKYIQSSH